MKGYSGQIYAVVTSLFPVIHSIPVLYADGVVFAALSNMHRVALDLCAGNVINARQLWAKGVYSDVKELW